MNKSKKEEEVKLNIYQRISAIMDEVDYVAKGDVKLNNQYRFVSHDSVSAALHKPMVKHGVCMIPTVEKSEIDGNRVIAYLKVSFVNIDNPKDLIEVRFPGMGLDKSDKGIGKAISYAVKYAMLKTFCLETGDDVEKDDLNYEPAKKPKIEVISQAAAFELEQLLRGDLVLRKRILTKAGIETFAQLPQEMLSKVLEYVKTTGV